MDEVAIQNCVSWYIYTTFSTGENVEELFTRIAVVAFEMVLSKEFVLAASPPPSNGQLSKHSTLISEPRQK